MIAMTHQMLSNRTRRAAMSILSGVLVGSASIWAVPAAGAEPSDATNATVSYELTGSGLAGYVTYATDSGQLHATNVPLPWSMQVTRSATNPNISTSSSLSAQSAGPGSLTCVIKLNGKVVSQNTATGDPARVVCESHEGRAPTTTSTPTTGNTPVEPGGG